MIPFARNSERISWVKADNENIRAAPGLSGKIIDNVGKDARIEVLGIDPYYYTIDEYRGHWIQIKYGEGKTGFIFEKYIEQWWQ